MAELNIDIASTAVNLNRHVAAFAPEIGRKFRIGLEWETMLPVIQAEGDVYVAQNDDIGELLQPYQGGFTAKGTVSHDEVPNQIRPIKMDIQLTEVQLAKYFNTWASLKYFDPEKEKYTFAQYLIEVLITEKYQEELNAAEWSGVFAAPTAGTPGASLASIDGFKKVIENAVTATSLTPLPTGAFTAANILPKVETWAGAMPEVFRKRKGKIIMAAGHARTYAQVFHEKYGGLYTQNAGSPRKNAMAPVSGYDFEVVGVSAMEGSNRWIFLPDGQTNMAVVSRAGAPLYPQFKFREQPRAITMEATFYRSCAFHDWRRLLVNDQA